MKICSWGKDGGADSKVWGFWLIEWKRWFSVALLVFEDGSRDAYHTHAFNAWSWVLRGDLTENIRYDAYDRRFKIYQPSIWPIYTPRERMHKVESKGRTWVLTFRGPWVDKWLDHDVATGRTSVLTHGRQEVME